MAFLGTDLIDALAMQSVTVLGANQSPLQTLSPTESHEEVGGPAARSGLPEAHSVQAGEEGGHTTSFFGAFVDGREPRCRLFSVTLDGIGVLSWCAGPGCP